MLRTIRALHRGIHRNLSSIPPIAAKTRIRNILNCNEDEIIGKSLTVQGWVRSLRSQKSTTFIEVQDGSSINGLQGVLDSQSNDFDVGKLTVGCSVKLNGIVAKSLGKNQKYDFQISSIVILGECPVDSYPFQRKHKTSPEQLRAIAHLRARTPTMGAITRIRSQITLATHTHFQSEGHVFVHTPLITGSDCEGAGEMFRVTTLPIDDPSIMPRIKDSVAYKQQQLINSTNSSTANSSVIRIENAMIADGNKTDFHKDFFHKPTYLTVSGQLSAESYACALTDVYTFGPTFRAEKSDTNRHLAEFYMVEPEMSFCDLHDAMDSAEKYVKAAVHHAFKHCPEELQFFQKFYDKELFNRLNKYLPLHAANLIQQSLPVDPTFAAPATALDTPFVRISYHEAVALLQQEIGDNKKKQWQYPNLKLGDDLHTEHERWLATVKFNQSCVFVYNYPKKIKSFYMRDNDEYVPGSDVQTVNSFDLLVPGVGELIGGSQREERLDRLEQKILEQGLKLEDYSWYLDLRRFGTVPHSGYGVGFERLLCFLTGMECVRDVIPFPRYLGKAEF